MQKSQADLLDLQRELIGQDRKTSQLYESVFLRQSGYEKRFIPNPRNAARTARLQGQIAALKAQQSTPLGKLFSFKTDPQIAVLQREMDAVSGRWELVQLPEFKKREETMRRLEDRRLQLDLQRTEELAGIEKERGGVERLSLKRQKLALEGKLPIDKGLLKDLATGERDLRAQLFSQLGAGFETSTPGIEAIREFRDFRAATLDKARRGDIGSIRPLEGGQQFQYAPATLQQPTSFASAYGDLSGRYGEFQGGLAKQRMSQFELTTPGSRGFSAGRALGGAAGGAAMGALYGTTGGPIGSGVGAVLGGIAGLFGGFG